MVEQLNNEVLLLQRLETSDQEIVGTKAYVPVHTNRSSGVGAAGEYVQLPLAGNQSYDRAFYDLTYQYGVVRVSGPSMAKTASEAGAFLQALRSELDGIRNDLKKDVARQSYGNGDGTIAKCGTTSASNVVVLSSAEAINKGQFYNGMLVDIGTTANPTLLAASQAISAISATNKTITIPTAITTSSSNFVFRANSSFAGGTYEMNGLQNLIPTAANTLGGIDGSANTYWDVQRDTAGTAITQDRCMQMFNKIRVAGGEVSAMYTSYGVQREFYNTFTSNIRYTEPLKLQGGFQTLTFFGKPLIADIDAIYANVYFLDERFIKVFANQDWHFLDEDNQPLKWDIGYDAWKAVLARYLNVGFTRRNTMGVLTTDVTNGY